MTKLAHLGKAPHPKDKDALQPGDIVWLKGDDMKFKIVSRNEHTGIYKIKPCSRFFNIDYTDITAFERNAVRMGI